MLGDRGAGDAERLGQPVDGLLSVAQEREQLAPGRVGDRVKDVAPGGGAPSAASRHDEI